MTESKKYNVLFPKGQLKKTGLFSGAFLISRGLGPTSRGALCPQQLPPSCSVTSRPPSCLPVVIDSHRPLSEGQAHPGAAGWLHTRHPALDSGRSQRLTARGGGHLRATHGRTRERSEPRTAGGLAVAANVVPGEGGSVAETSQREQRVGGTAPGPPVSRQHMGLGLHCRPDTPQPCTANPSARSPPRPCPRLPGATVPHLVPASALNAPGLPPPPESRTRHPAPRDAPSCLSVKGPLSRSPVCPPPASEAPSSAPGAATPRPSARGAG